MKKLIFWPLLFLSTFCYGGFRTDYLNVSSSATVLGPIKAASATVTSSQNELIKLVRPGTGSNVNGLLNFYTNPSGTEIMQRGFGYFNTNGTGLGIEDGSNLRQWQMASTFFPDSLAMRIYTLSGDNYVAFEASDSLTTNPKWTFPLADGSNNSLMSTNGSGQLSFVSISSNTSGSNNFILNQTELQSASFHVKTGSITMSDTIDPVLSLTGPVGCSGGETTTPNALNIYSTDPSGLCTDSTSSNIGFFSLNSSGDMHEFGRMEVYPLDPSSGSEVGSMNLLVADGNTGVLDTALNINSTGGQFALYSPGSMALDGTMKARGGLYLGTNDQESFNHIPASGEIRTSTHNAMLGRSELRFRDSDNSNYVALRSSASLNTNTAFTLPLRDGASGHMLITDGNGNLQFSANFSSATLPIGSTNYIQNRATLQSNSTFYVNRGEIEGDLVMSWPLVANKVTLRATTISSARTITIPNASGTMAVSATSPVAVSAAGNISLTNPLPIANGGTNNTSAYTNRSIIFSNGTSLTQDNGTLNFDSTTDNMGIGTANSSSAVLTLSPASTTEASMNLGKGSSPTLPNDGDFWWQSNTYGIASYSSKMVSPVSSVVCVSTGLPAARNTSNETGLSSATIGAVTIPANGVTLGKMIGIHARGIMGTDGAAAPDFTFKIYLGTITHGDTGAITLPTGLTSTQWKFDWFGTVKSVGASGKVIGQGEFSYYDSAASAWVVLDMTNTTTVDYNTAANQQVSITAKWSAADNDNTITATNYWWGYDY